MSSVEGAAPAKSWLDLPDLIWERIIAQSDLECDGLALALSCKFFRKFLIRQRSASLERQLEALRNQRRLAEGEARTSEGNGDSSSEEEEEEDDDVEAVAAAGTAARNGGCVWTTNLAAILYARGSYTLEGESMKFPKPPGYKCARPRKVSRSWLRWNYTMVASLGGGDPDGGHGEEDGDDGAFAAWEVWKEGEERAHRAKEYLFAIACALGYVDVCEWLRLHRCPLLESACIAAAEANQLGVLEWLKGDVGSSKSNAEEGGEGQQEEEEEEGGERVCPWSGETFAWAAAVGNMETISWLYDNGCPWDDRTSVWAASEGRTDVLRWLKLGSDGGGIGYPRTSWVTMATSLAARNNHLEALTWLTSNGCPVSDIQAMKWAAGGGHVRILAFLKGRNYFWDSIVCAQAALGGKLETLQWLRANGCPWGEKTCDFAAFKGHLKILEWARENGCPASRWLCTSTAAHGQMRIMAYLREEGFPVSEFTMAFAAKGGHLRLVRWLARGGCPMTQEATKAAAGAGHIHVLRWLRKKNCPWSKDVCHQAAKFGQLEALQWLRDKSVHKGAGGVCPWQGRVICREAAKGGHVHLIRWAVSQGCPLDGEVVYIANIMAKHGHLSGGCTSERASERQLQRIKSSG